jgi:hypothetical protein
MAHATDDRLREVSMASFGEALKKGLEAHRRAAETRREIDEVLAAASADVAAVTSAPISLQLQVVDRPKREPSFVENVHFIPPPREQFTALTARLSPGTFRVLGEVTFGELGYPVTIRWEDYMDSAYDRVSFEKLIATILAHGATGKHIAELITGSK